MFKTPRFPRKYKISSETAPRRSKKNHATISETWSHTHHTPRVAPRHAATMHAQAQHRKEAHLCTSATKHYVTYSISTLASATNCLRHLRQRPRCSFFSQNVVEKKLPTVRALLALPRYSSSLVQPKQIPVYYPKQKSEDGHCITS